VEEIVIIMIAREKFMSTIACEDVSLVASGVDTKWVRGFRGFSESGLSTPREASHKTQRHKKKRPIVQNLLNETVNAQRGLL